MEVTVVTATHKAHGVGKQFQVQATRTQPTCTL